MGARGGNVVPSWSLLNVCKVDPRPDRQYYKNGASWRGGGGEEK